MPVTLLSGRPSSVCHARYAQLACSSAADNPKADSKAASNSNPEMKQFRRWGMMKVYLIGRARASPMNHLADLAAGGGVYPQDRLGDGDVALNFFIGRIRRQSLPEGEILGFTQGKSGEKQGRLPGGPAGPCHQVRRQRPLGFIREERI